MNSKHSSPHYPTEEDYKHYDKRTHVYMKADTYIGCDERLPREEWLYKNNKISLQKIDFTPGCERIFLEILSNASDNCGKSKRAGVDCKQIEVTMTKTTTIEISKGAAKELNKIKGDLMKKSGRKATYDDAIKFLLNRKR